jgi:alkyldihydroxyacetonephosphate synthase
VTKRLWWGWGTAGEAVNGAEADALVQRARSMLPDHDFTDHPPPDPATLAIDDPRVEPPESLRHLMSVDRLDRAAHTHGKAYRDVIRNLQGRLANPPDLVARPRNERDVVDLLDWCTTAALPIIPYGGGSSVVGGVEARFEGPALTIDLSRLDRVLEVDHVSRAARIQAGVLGPSLEDQLRPHGLTLRHFPQSFAYSTLGGWLATRAGGHFATVYTHIDDLTEAIRVVTPTGISQTRRLPGDGAGPAPDRLFLGSEGALGIITEAWLRLQQRPSWRAGASVAFTDYDRAVEATRAIAQSGLYPTNCRLLDPAEAFLNASTPTGGGLLVLAFESADHPVDSPLRRAVDIATSCGGELQPRSADGAGRWRDAFLRMPYYRDAMARRNMIVETFETAVTWDRFAATHAAITDAARRALDEVGSAGVVTCRFTHVYPDGPAPYYGVYASGRWGSLVAQWDDIKSAVSEAIIGNGGTITHHHAVGRDHMPWYTRQTPQPFQDVLRAAKAALDPASILNPGVLLRAPDTAPPPAGGH